MRLFLTLFLLLFSFQLFSQNSILSDSLTKGKNNLPTHLFQATGALVSYYFWEEDSFGFIRNNEVKQPYLQNYSILIATNKFFRADIDYERLSSAISIFSHVKTKVKSKRFFKIVKDNKKVKINYPLIREEVKAIESVIYIKKNNKWVSLKKGSVIYFTVDPTNKWRYSYSSDSLIINNQKSVYSNGHYLVLNYCNQEDKIERQEVYSNTGQTVTNDLTSTISILPQRVLVFANGYRGPKTNKDETDHLVTNKDRYHYWFKLDNQFIERLMPAESYYIDGSMSVKTSNHKSMVNFALSFFRSTFILRKKRAKKHFETLNTHSNLEGFQLRKDKGRIAGKAFLTALCNSPACQNTKDTVDIVCHSMGYAYTLGFIEEIKEKVVFGKIYIIAPENACADGADWSIFQEVWQYGSNLDQENPDPIWQQDGIAPQCQVKGLEILPAQKGGRVFIPIDWPRKNFIESHMPYNFDWIFERINKGEKGYIYR